MNRTAQYLLAIVLCAAMAPPLLSSAASDDGRAKRSRDTAAAGKDRSADAPGEEWEHDPVVFSASDRDAIRTFFRRTSLNISPGLAGRDGDSSPRLPKHLQRNGMLPIGLQKRMQPLSGDLERRLQSLYSGYARGMVGRDVVIVETSTQRIMDIIRDVTTLR